MPYERNIDLPRQTDVLSDRQKTIFRRAYNSARERHPEGDAAFRIAWQAVVDAGYEPLGKSSRNLGKQARHYDTNEELPAQTDVLSEEQKTIFRTTYNSARRRHPEGDAAFRIAWEAVVDAGYEPLGKKSQLLLKVAAKLGDPRVDPAVRAVAVHFMKSAGFMDAFGAIGDIGSGIMDLGGAGLNFLSNTISSAASDFMGTAGFTASDLYNKAMQLMPELSLEIGGLSQAEVTEAIKSALSEVGMSVAEFLRLSR